MDFNLYLENLFFLPGQCYERRDHNFIFYAGSVKVICDYLNIPYRDKAPYEEPKPDPKSMVLLGMQIDVVINHYMPSDFVMFVERMPGNKIKVLSAFSTKSEVPNDHKD